MVVVPVEIDIEVGFLILQSLDFERDELNEEQYKYIHGYKEGN